MVDGLDITESQFMKMKSVDRDLVMFRNVTMIRTKFKDYAFHRKIQYVWLTILTVAIGLKRFLGV